ncbi:MAG: hypothetical protein OHK0039_16320 [Bacteroidia bacterium]
MLSAQPTSGPEIIDLQGEALAVQPVQSWVWQVSHPRSMHVSYIYGILYQVPEDYFFLPPGLDEYIAQADRLVMEVDPSTDDQEFIHRGSTPIDSTLEHLLPLRDYPDVWAFLQDSLSPVARYKLSQRYYPLLLSRQINCDYCLGHRRGTPLVSYEWYLYDAINKPLKVLNTGWTRTAWLDAYTFREQALELAESIRQRQPACETYWAMLRAYRRQDLDKVWLLAQDAPDLGDNMGRFIEARNVAWVRSLQYTLQLENLFIAVNAVQLPGEYGLLHQLRKAGFVVTPVQWTPTHSQHE